MSAAVLFDAVILAGGYDLSGRSNTVEIDATVESKDATTFRSGGWRELAAGLWDSSMKMSGFYSAGFVNGTDNALGSEPDDLLFANLGATPDLLYGACSGSADGATCYFAKALQLSYAPLGQVGEIIPFNATAAGKAKMRRGTVLHPANTERTSTGTGTARQLGAVGSTQTLYAGLWVTSIKGTSAPSLAVKIQSDNASGFPSATDQITFTTATGIGAEHKQVAGAITDDWWRISYTITGTSPGFRFVVAAGIAAT